MRRDEFRKLKSEGYFVCLKCGLLSKDTSLFIKGKNLCKETDLVLSNSRHHWKGICNMLGKTSQVSADKILQHAKKKVSQWLDRDLIVRDLILLTKGVLSRKEAYWIYIYCMTNTKFGLLLMSPGQWQDAQLLYRELVGPYNPCYKRQKDFAVKQKTFFPEFEKINHKRKSKKGIRIPDPGP